MPTFATPSPIAVIVELGVGDIQIAASDRTDTVVQVSPSDPEKKGDVAAAEHARVEYDQGKLVIKAAKGWKQYTFTGGRDSIDVRIDLPAGSHLHGDTGVAALVCRGRLGECHYRTGLGDIRIEQVGPLELRTGSGDISVERALGEAEITTRSGALRIGAIAGPAVIKNSNGDTWIGRVGGELRVNAANGKIAVEQAQAGVEAKTANGDVRLGEVGRGTVVIRTAYGKVDVGIRHGVAAWLDLVTGFGNVRNDLGPAEGPQPGEDSVEVRARTAFGDVTIYRALPENSRESVA